MFEIRDAGTHIPAMGIKLVHRNEAEARLLSRAGYDLTDNYVFLCKIDGGECGGNYDPYGWPGRARTMQVAHSYIVAHFDELVSGQVIDVQYIIGETTTPKRSENY